MKRNLVTCSHCGGTGQKALSPVLQPVMDAIPRKGSISTRDVAIIVADPYLTSATAVNNRLTTLQTLGLIDWERRGKKLFWRRK